MEIIKVVGLDEEVEEEDEHDNVSEGKVVVNGVDRAVEVEEDGDMDESVMVNDFTI